MNTTPICEQHHAFSFSRISWGAILAGAVTGLTLGSLLNLLGLGLGFAAFQADSETLAKIGTGSSIWLIVSGIVAMLGAGWVSGWFINTACRVDGALHGLISWGLATLTAFILMASAAGAVISGTASLVGQGVSVAAKTIPAVGKGIAQAAESAKDVLPDVTPAIHQAIDQITQQLEQTVRRSTSDSAAGFQLTQQNKNELRKIVWALLNASNENDKSAVRQKVVNFLSQNTEMSSSQAEQTVNDWERSYEQIKAQVDQKLAEAKEKAKIAAEKAAETASSIALSTFFALVMSALAAAIGGLLGTSMAAKKSE
jgi:preprotein translocase subunit SecE